MYSIVTLITPIQCENIEKVPKTQLVKEDDCKLDSSQKIIILKGIVEYKKTGIIVKNSINDYFIPYFNVAGISSFYYNNNKS